MTQGLSQVVNFKIAVINQSSIKHCPIFLPCWFHELWSTLYDFVVAYCFDVNLNIVLFILNFYLRRTKLFKILSSFVSLWWKRKIKVMKSNCLSCFSRCRMMPIFWDFYELGISIWTRYGVRCNYFCIM